MYTKRFNLVIFALLALVIALPGGVAHAADTNTTEATTTSTETSSSVTTEDTDTAVAASTTVDEVTADDLGVAEPSVLPGSFLYPFKRLSESIQEVFTFNAQSKAELSEHLANKRLVEARALARDGKTDEAVKILDDYKARLDQAQTKLAAIDRTKLTQDQVAKLEKVEDRLTSNLLKQERVLERVQDQVPEVAKEKIKEHLSQAQEKIEDRISKLPAGDQEKAKARLDEIISQLPGDEVSKVEYLQALKTVRADIVPEAIKAQIEIKATEHQAKIDEAVKAGTITAEQAAKRIEAVKLRAETRVENLDVRTKAEAELKDLRDQAKDAVTEEAKKAVQDQAAQLKNTVKQTVEQNKEIMKDELKANANRAVEEKKKEAADTATQKAEQLRKMLKPEEVK
ncbi:MAG: DUF5667 domain-containing protein [Patescibacteria group bacterium]